MYFKHFVEWLWSVILTFILIFQVIQAWSYPSTLSGIIVILLCVGMFIHYASLRLELYGWRKYKGNKRAPSE